MLLSRLALSVVHVALLSYRLLIMYLHGGIESSFLDELNITTVVRDLVKFSDYLGDF